MSKLTIPGWFQKYWWGSSLVDTTKEQPTLGTFWATVSHVFQSYGQNKEKIGRTKEESDGEVATETQYKSANKTVKKLAIFGFFGISYAAATQGFLTGFLHWKQDDNVVWNVLRAIGFAIGNLIRMVFTTVSNICGLFVELLPRLISDCIGLGTTACLKKFNEEKGHTGKQRGWGLLRAILTIIRTPFLLCFWIGRAFLSPFDSADAASDAVKELFEDPKSDSAKWAGKMAYALSWVVTAITWLIGGIFAAKMISAKIAKVVADNPKVKGEWFIKAVDWIGNVLEKIGNCPGFKQIGRLLGKTFGHFLPWGKAPTALVSGTAVTAGVIAPLGTMSTGKIFNSLCYDGKGKNLSDKIVSGNEKSHKSYQSGNSITEKPNASKSNGDSSAEQECCLWSWSTHKL